MHIAKLAGVFNLAAAAVLVLCQSTMAQSAGFSLKKDAKGMVQPFAVKDMKLHEFIAAYADFTKIPMRAEGPWDQSVKGNVTLYVNHPIKDTVLTELFFQVLLDNDFTVIDAPFHDGWIIERTRDAKDAAIQTYDSSNYPKTYRYITVVHPVKHISAEETSRIMRNFMPYNTRVIAPSGAASRQLIITASGRDIGSLLATIDILDTDETSPVAKEFASHISSKNTCQSSEKTIEKLVVQKLEINESNINTQTVGGKKQ